MWRLCLIAIAAFHFANGLVMWFAPHFWYEAVPGVAMMGPFNLHFIRDIALVFGMSAGALAYGAYARSRAAAIIGASSNLTAIQLPAWLALAAALNFARKEAAR